MTTSSTAKHWIRRPRTLLLLVGLLVLSVVYAPSALATHPGDPSGDGIQATSEDDNPTCSTLVESDGELRVEPVASGSYSDGELTVTITVDNTDDGQTFDFVAEGATVTAVFVKGGPNGNLYDYRPAGNNDDTALHSPVNDKNDKYYGLSHISFCYDEIVSVDAVLSGTKFLDGTLTGLDGWKIDILDADQMLLSTETTNTEGKWSYTTEEFEQGTDVTLYVCEQEQAGWTQTSPDSSDSGTIAIAGYDGPCHVVTFTAGATQEQIPGLDFANRPSGAIKIVKTAKHADDSGETSPNLAATFTVKDSSGAPAGTITTDATTGVGCLDGLAPGTYSIEETGVPSGYAAPSIDPAVVPGDAQVACGDGDEVTVDVENTPLTDITWTVDSQHDGATSTLVQCWDEEGVLVYNQSVSDGTASFTDLLPTDPDVTLRCDFTVDP